MTNSYVSLDVFKGEGVMNIAGDGGDGLLLSLLESVSRMVDRYCNRHFYVLEATRRFDGDGGERLLVPDLVSVDEAGLKTDDDLDGVFETAWEAGEYVLLPLNADPGSRGNAGSRPYTSVAVSGGAGSERRWPVGRATVQVAGQWGMVAPPEAHNGDDGAYPGRGGDRRYGLGPGGHRGGRHAAGRVGADVRAELQRGHPDGGAGR